MASPKVWPLERPVYWLFVTPFTVRAALPTDASALEALHRGIYDEGRWFVGDAAPSAETLRSRLRLLDEKRSSYLVAVGRDGGGRDGALQGWVELHRLTPQRLSHVAVLTLAVGHLYRRQGVAGALLEAAYPWAAAVGVLKLQLSVRAGNGAAVALYEREGFVLEGCERNQVFDDGGFEDNLLMAKFL